MIENASISYRLALPSRKFNRQVGIYSGHHFTPDGILIPAEEWEQHRSEWLPTEADRAYVGSLMSGVYEQGKIANWIGIPERGINGKPFDFEYVRFS